MCMLPNKLFDLIDLIKIIRIISRKSYLPIGRPSLHEKLINEEIKFGSKIAQTIRLTHRKSYIVVVWPN